MSSRDLALAAQELAAETVVVPEWGGATFLVREMDATTRSAWEDEREAAREANDGKEENGTLGAIRLLRFTLHEPDGTRSFQEPADAQLLGKKSVKVLMRLFDVALRVNRVGEKEAEKAAGGSVAAPSGDS